MITDFAYYNGTQVGTTQTVDILPSYPPKVAGFPKNTSVSPTEVPA